MYVVSNIYDGEESLPESSQGNHIDINFTVKVIMMELGCGHKSCREIGV